MKVVILAGGFGSRLSEETHLKPKPMIEIGGIPILVHIMKIYSHFGFNEFILCLGYKGEIIKEYFKNFLLHNSDIKIDLENNQIDYLNRSKENWKVSLIDTGKESMTGGRLLRLKNLIDDTFFLTYGDGVADVNISSLLKHHKKSNKIATVTAVKPPGRFGSLKLDGNLVKEFIEKPDGDLGRINGGFFVFEKQVFDYLDNDSTVLENEPLKKLANENNLNAYFHDSFWCPMDTLRDKNFLEQAWLENPKWKVWD